MKEISLADRVVDLTTKGFVERIEECIEICEKSKTLENAITALIIYKEMAKERLRK